MRFVVAALLFVRAHFSLTALIPTPAGKAWLFWPIAADSKPVLGVLGGLPAALNPAFSGVSAAAFMAAVLALFGLFVPAGWWPTLVLVGATTSFLLYVLYLGRWAALPIAIDAVLLWGVLVQHWSVSGLRGFGS